MKQYINIEDYNYNLPENRIAKYPLSHRDKSKLLLYTNNQINEMCFEDLINILSPNNTLVYNDTKVINARFYFLKETGAKIEIFCLEPIIPKNYESSLTSSNKCVWKCLVGNSKKWKKNGLNKKIIINKKEFDFFAKKIETFEDSFLIEFSWNNKDVIFLDILEKYGYIPIPPYLNRNSEDIDKIRYQTVYGKINGSVAAPTAGLHFTDNLIEKLKLKGIKFENISLHVGAGTFQPVKTENVKRHPMHVEKFSISKKSIINLSKNLDNLVIVGTTTLRSLESLYFVGRQIMNNKSIYQEEFFVNQWEGYSYNERICNKVVFQNILNWMCKYNIQHINCSTQIMIVPGYDFRICEKLITNFHQPKSTLLLLIAAFVGNRWKNIYKYALENDFRFLSYGDSMFLEKN